MTIAYLWLYLLVLSWIWWFYIIARIHAYKFKNMSTHIGPVTNTLFFILLILSVIWFIMIFFLDTTSRADVFIEEFEEENVQLEQEIF